MLRLLYCPEDWVLICADWKINILKNLFLLLPHMMTICIWSWELIQKQWKKKFHAAETSWYVGQLGHEKLCETSRSTTELRYAQFCFKRQAVIAQLPIVRLIYAASVWFYKLPQLRQWWGMVFAIHSNLLAQQVKAQIETQEWPQNPLPRRPGHANNSCFHSWIRNAKRCTAKPSPDHISAAVKSEIR